MTRLARGGGGKVRAEVEQLVLDERQFSCEPLAQACGKRDADLRVELVDRAVRFHPLGILRDALPTAESGHPLVAGLRVDPVEPWHPPIVPHASGPAFAASSLACYHPSVIQMEDITSHVVFGGTSAARAGTEAGDHHRVCHQGR